MIKKDQRANDMNLEQKQRMEVTFYFIIEFFCLYSLKYESRSFGGFET
jgi:hypothetical protein